MHGCILKLNFFFWSWFDHRLKLLRKNSSKFFSDQQKGQDALEFFFAHLCKTLQAKYLEIYEKVCFNLIKNDCFFMKVNLDFD